MSAAGIDTGRGRPARPDTTTAAVDAMFGEAFGRMLVRLYDLRVIATAAVLVMGAWLIGAVALQLDCTHPARVMVPNCDPHRSTR